MTASDHSYETAGDRASLAREAGVGRLSFISVLAGVLVAYGAFAVLAALVGAAATAVGLNNDLSRNDWAALGIGSAIAAAIVLFLAYLFGGYVAGRMARRAGLINGVAVFVVAVLLVAALGALIASGVNTQEGETALSNLRGLGIPTTGDEWRGIATLAGIGSLLAMLAGALLGGVLGDRYHTRLTRQAEKGYAKREEEEARERQLREREDELEREKAILEHEREAGRDRGVTATEPPAGERPAARRLDDGRDR
jgi:hypothetical protein